MAHPQPAIIMPPRLAVGEVARIAGVEAVAEIFVGLPLTLAGGESAQTRDARGFASALRALVDVPVREWDERLSTVEAAGRLTGRRERRDGTRDSAAAALILQAVLDSRRNPPA
jgi:putative Holliday junction resolvase